MLRRLVAMAPAAAPACRTMTGGSGTSPGATQVVIALGTNEVSAIPFAPQAHPPPVGCCGTSGCAADPHLWYNLTHPHLRYAADHASRTPRASNVTHPGGAECAAAEGAVADGGDWLAQGPGATMLREAVRALEPEGVRVVRHSCLYETAPAYVSDQPRFLNAAVLAHTRLPPASLLDSLKRIEKQLGRDLAGPVSPKP
jgi:hypothetical protein